MRAYNLLLRLYPASFRHEYGEEMRVLFARLRRDAQGPLRVTVLWLSTIVETLANAALVHGDLLKQDLAYTARVLRRAPGFAVTAVVVVALGIGATTAAFSVTDFVLIRPLPFPEPERLVKIWESTPGYPTMELSAPNYRDWTAAAQSFESAGVYHANAVTMMGAGEPRRFFGSSVSADLFPTLGVAPILVRVLSAFAVIAFVLAAVGIHGLLSFTVSQRAQEIGVRRALGAQAGDILSMVLGRCVRLAGVGVIVGVALAYVAGRQMEALLAGVKPADVTTLAAAVGLAIVMTVAGSVMPTLRALRVDPISAIRAE